MSSAIFLIEHNIYEDNIVRSLIDWIIAVLIYEHTIFCNLKVEFKLLELFMLTFIVLEIGTSFESKQAVEQRIGKWLKRAKERKAT